MKKFTSIRESKDFGKFIMSDNDFGRYKRTIDFLLKEDLYKEYLVKVDRLVLVKALPSERSIGREYSTLNKVNTNIALTRKLIERFDLNNVDDLIKFVEENKVDLFTEDGKYFKNLVFTTIRSTEKKGEENEDFVCEYIKRIVKIKFNEDISPVREVTSSYKDMILGIDITFTVNGKDYTCQVKPLISVSQTGDYIRVMSSGLIKEYDTNYIAFVNIEKNMVLLFRNTKADITINGVNIAINKKNLVNI
jgi:hypothetical protein